MASTQQTISTQPPTATTSTTLSSSASQSSSEAEKKQSTTILSSTYIIMSSIHNVSLPVLFSRGLCGIFLAILCQSAQLDIVFDIKSSNLFHSYSIWGPRSHEIEG